MLGEDVRVALEKLGVVEEENFDDVMEINIGSEAEPFVLDAYENHLGLTGTLQRNLDTLLHPEYTWLGCHRDAWHPGVNVEAKTVGPYNRDQWGDGGDEVPDYVLWQVQQQMAVSGDLVTDIPVCFINGHTLKYLFLRQPPPITIFQVRKDFELVDYLLRKSEHVWECIQQGITPAPRTVQAVNLIYPKAIEPSIEADDNIVQAWRDLLDIKEIKKETDKREAELKHTIQLYMGSAAVLEKGGVTLATWKNDGDGEKFDEKRFADENPELYRKYIVPRQGSRKFLPKAPKKEKK